MDFDVIPKPPRFTNLKRLGRSAAAEQLALRWPSQGTNVTQIFVPVCEGAARTTGAAESLVAEPCLEKQRVVHELQMVVRAETILVRALDVGALFRVVAHHKRVSSALSLVVGEHAELSARALRIAIGIAYVFSAELRFVCLHHGVVLVLHAT